jgi:hypothetical protein
VDTAELMFNQENGKRHLYVSLDGSATVLDENHNCISAYGKGKFDPSIKAIIELIEVMKK